jgi:hypothetical protein
LFSWRQWYFQVGQGMREIRTRSKLLEQRVVAARRMRNLHVGGRDHGRALNMDEAILWKVLIRLALRLGTCRYRQPRYRYCNRIDRYNVTTAPRRAVASAIDSSPRSTYCSRTQVQRSRYELTSVEAPPGVRAYLQPWHNHRYNVPSLETPAQLSVLSTISSAYTSMT